MTRKLNLQNLVPNEKRTPEERRKNATKAGKASGKARKEKKLMSQIFAELISNGLDKDIERAAPKIIREGGSPAVSMMREIREATEGSKSKTETTLNVNIDDANVADIMARHGVSQSKN